MTRAALGFMVLADPGFADFESAPIPGGFVVGLVTTDVAPLLPEEVALLYARLRERLEAAGLYDGAVFGLYCVEDNR